MRPPPALLVLEARLPTWGTVVAMRIVDHLASLAAGAPGQRGGKYPKHYLLPGCWLDDWRLDSESG
jgi:hypothetical protein